MEPDYNARCTSEHFSLKKKHIFKAATYSARVKKNYFSLAGNKKE